jgi:hypothetical protein
VTVVESHDIAIALERKIEAMVDIEIAFVYVVHIDTYMGVERDGVG